jgi:lipoprotein-anchoring transpeptidase ErfK/SrfK
VEIRANSAPQRLKPLAAARRPLVRSTRFVIGNRPVRALALALVAAAWACVPGSATASSPASARAAAAGVAHWAYVEVPAFVRSAPRRGARKLARLTTATYHGRPETVLVLGWVSNGTRSWVKVRYPGLGDRRGFVPAATLSRPRRTTHRLVLDRTELELRLLRAGRTVFRTAVGVGALGSPTPAGRYYIRERIVPTAPGTVYGALAFGTSAYSPYRTDWPGGGQVGIHGTNQPALIPGHISNGCVRLPDARVLELGRRLRIGTPLLIR